MLLRTQQSPAKPTMGTWAEGFQSQLVPQEEKETDDIFKFKEDQKKIKEFISKGRWRPKTDK